MSIAILGSGAFGTALAISLAGKGPVTLWSRNAEQAKRMATDRENKDRLAGVALPQNVSITSNIAVCADCQILLLAIPMQQLRSALAEYSDFLSHKILVACCKGIELETCLGPLSVIEQELPDSSSAILTGPSFAADIARGLPTALTLACQAPDLCRDLQHSLTTDNLRLYRTQDTIGAELGGALKNVIAIACGAVIGAGLGDSARAALMTRGYAEMQRMAQSLGASSDTLAGLSGFGDLTLTCSSDQSRNFRLGLSIGQGEKFDPSITVEGVATARAVVVKAADMKLDMPISQTVVALLDNRLTIQDAIAHLLARPLKEE